jgi:hypothetical protein
MSLELTICLFPSKANPERFQAIQRSYRNLSQESISLLIEDHETYKFEMRTRQGKNNGLTNRKLIWEGDMEYGERAGYTWYVLEPDQGISFKVPFSKFKKQVSSTRGIKMHLPFSMYFLFPQTYFRLNERGDYLDAMRVRTAERNKVKSFPSIIDYKDIKIDWE